MNSMTPLFMRSNFRFQKTQLQSKDINCYTSFDEYPNSDLSFNFNCCLAVPQTILGNCQGDNLTSLLITEFLFHVRTEGHWELCNEVGYREPCNEVESIRPIKHPAWNGNVHIPKKRLDPLRYSRLQPPSYSPLSNISLSSKLSWRPMAYIFKFLLKNQMS